VDRTCRVVFEHHRRRVVKGGGMAGDDRNRSSSTLRHIVSRLNERSVLAIYAAVAALYARSTPLEPHRIWAWVAFGAYVLALGLSLCAPRRRIGSVVAFTGSILVSTCLLVALELGQPELRVLVDGARSVLARGTPYLAAPDSVYDFHPYLPALYVFGLPRALWGQAAWTDPRVPGLVAVLAVLAVLISRSGPRRTADNVADLLLILSCPLIAVAWVASFIDVPQTALTLLALVMVRAKPTGAGVVAGVTVAMKPTGLCLLFILFLYVRTERGAAAGYRLAAAGLAVAAVLIVPFVLVDPMAAFENVLRFPVGAADLPTPAATPFPGALIHEWVGLRFALVGMCIGAVAYGAFCWRSPPRTIRAAAGQFAGGVALATLLAPTSRVGYLVLPLVVVAAIWIFVPRVAEGPGSET
jgi:hypothetical protein